MKRTAVVKNNWTYFFIYMCVCVYIYVCVCIYIYFIFWHAPHLPPTPTPMSFHNMQKDCFV